MSLFPPAFPIRTEHYRAIPRLVLQNYACSPQLFIQELTVENKPGHTPRLITFHAILASGLISQLYERLTDSSIDDFHPSTRFYLTRDHALASLSICGDYALEILWHIKTPSPSVLTFAISAITVFGLSPRAPYDLACDLLANMAQSFEHDMPNAVHASFQPDKATFSLNLIAWLFNALECGTIDCTQGQLSLQMRSSGLRLRFDRKQCHASSSARSPIRITSFLPETPQIQAFSTASLQFKPTPSKSPAIERIHALACSRQPLPETDILNAIREAQASQSPCRLQVLLYFINKWSPDAADLVRLYLLTDKASTTTQFPLAFDILKKIYQQQNDEDMLLALIQQRAHDCAHAPHMRIRLMLDAANILSQSFQRIYSAVSILESLKPLIQSVSTPEEKIAFANAYCLAQYHNTAIQYLQLWLNQADKPRLIAKYGVCLAHTMFEHNDPLQSIINVCRKVLDVDPKNLDTLSLLAQCLENSDNFEEAVDTYLLCFDLLISIWEQAKLRDEHSPSEANAQALDLTRQNAIKAAIALEHLIEKLPDYPAYSRILGLHQKLIPGDMTLLSKRLDILAQKHAFPEMIQACLDFLRINQDSIQPEDALTLHLTLHNIYDCEFNLPDEAQKHLEAAQKISKHDPRVLLTQIESCKRHNQPNEQIALMIELIDSLPNAKAVEQTLELVKLLESLNARSQKILDILRKVNNRYPNQMPILLELRQYLRKCGQFFELAIVLEKLARATKDLQTKKNLLLEASETNEKLGNTQLAQSLYHEAQLCSPINPDKFDFIPNDIKPGFPVRSNALDPLSSLTSVLLSSRSLSIAEIPALSNAPKTQDYTQLPASDISVSSEIISSSSAAIVTTAFQSDTSTLSSEDSDETSPIQDLIMRARLRGDTEALLAHLLQSISDIPEMEQPPRILQEIGCIYLYDRHDPQAARIFLERASQISPEVANGEQTLNALEAIYQSLKCFHELADIYQKKCKILTISKECKKYELRLAQLRYEHLKETDLAIQTLKNIISKTPDNETALQLLAQIYIDTRDFENAIQILNEISKYRVPGSKQMAQHQIRLLKLHIETGHIEAAKTEINKLLESNDFVDKLAIIEIYKHLCRERDEWTELLEILKTEIACLLKQPSAEIHEHFEKHLHDANISAASNSLREYADILYHKCNQPKEAATIYRALIHILPEHQYPKNMLAEIYAQYPEFNISDSDF